MTSVSKLSIKIFADGADLNSIRELAGNPLVKGFTTNPTLMRQAGVSDYKAFAHDVLACVPDRPVSFEVFADEFDEMEHQALEIASWGENVNVKIPVTNTKGESSVPLIARLAGQGVQVNVTAVFSIGQVKAIKEVLNPDVGAIVSVFAGRIADTGRDPVPHMSEALEILKPLEKAELLWASPRELLNIFQADEVGCHIITVTGGVLAKLDQVGKHLEDFSLETVEMFYSDAQSAGYHIPRKGS